MTPDPDEATLGPAVAAAAEAADSQVRRGLGRALVLVLLGSALSAVAPLALRSGIDVLARGEARTQDAVAWLIGYVAALGAARVAVEWRWRFFGSADRRLQRNLSRRLFSHVLRLPLAFHLHRGSGALNQTLVQGLAGYSVALNHLVFTVLPALLEVALVGLILATVIDAELATLLLASVAAYITASAIGVRWIRHPSHDVAAAQIGSYARLGDGLLNVELIKCFAADGWLTRRYDQALAAAEAAWGRFYAAKVAAGLLVAGVFTASLGAALLVAARRVEAGELSIGGFTLINAYMLQIVRPLETLGSALRDLAQAAAFIDRLTTVFRQPPEPLSDPHRTIDRDARQPASLAFDGVSFGYVPGRSILHDASFAASPGSLTAVVGSSGAGKSSIARLILHLYEPSSGAISLDGRPLSTMPVAALRAAVAVVPQDVTMLNDSILRNISLGRHLDDREVETAARLAGLHDRIEAMPDGYLTVVGERGLKLSGGERQRLAIARAVVRPPRLLVLDEATAALDPPSEAEIVTNLRRLGTTILLITHRLPTVRSADAIFVIEDGRIVEHGSHAALLAASGRYAALWRHQ